MATTTPTSESRPRKREVILPIPARVLNHSPYGRGDQLAFEITPSDRLRLTDPGQASAYAPTRPIRANNGGWTINLPARVRTALNLTDEHEFTWYDSRDEDSLLAEP